MLLACLQTPLAALQSQKSKRIHARTVRRPVTSLKKSLPSIELTKSLHAMVKVGGLPSHQLLWFTAGIYLDPGFEPLISQHWVLSFYTLDQSCVVSRPDRPVVESFVQKCICKHREIDPEFLVNSNRSRIVITLFWMIQHQTEVRVDFRLVDFRLDFRLNLQL